MLILYNFASTRLDTAPWPLTLLPPGTIPTRLTIIITIMRMTATTMVRQSLSLWSRR